jgi:hypothetical protein
MIRMQSRSPLASWWTSRAAPLRYIFVHPYTHMYGYIYFCKFITLCSSYLEHVDIERERAR